MGSSSDASRWMGGLNEHVCNTTVNVCWQAWVSLSSTLTILWPWVGYFACWFLFPPLCERWQHHGAHRDVTCDETSAQKVPWRDPLSHCSVHMHPLGTLWRCRFWLREAFPTSAQGMPKLLVHGPLFENQGYSEETTIQVLLTINNAECPVKPSSPELLFTDSISLLLIGLFRLSISSWLSFGGLYVFRNLSISSRLSSLLAYTRS